LDFRDQLRSRGIELVLLPVPVKPCIEGKYLSSRVGNGRIQNGSHGDFLARLEQAGVRVFDPAAGLEQDALELGAAYLETDTHWRPEAMERVAGRLATLLKSLPGLKAGGLQPVLAEKEVAGMGDTVGLLGLGPDQKLYGRQTVRIRQVTVGNGFLRPDPKAEVLVLGDSFSNIYSLEGMGWGEGAGFVEHLAAALGVQVDAVLRNSDGAFGSRELLRRELAAGRDRLAGKKVVIWEFASRELAQGDWRILEMQVGTPQPGRFVSLKSGEEFLVEGTVGAISAVPRPGTVPYAEHIVSVHLVDLRREQLGGDLTEKGAVRKEAREEALVYLWSMKGQQWTPAARVRSGDRVRLRLRAWETVSGQYEKVNRSELTDPNLVVEEPVWGEWVGEPLGESLR
jgi:alginate O-acetyltransferase complex protein AlgJ